MIILSTPRKHDHSHHETMIIKFLKAWSKLSRTMIILTSNQWSTQSTNDDQGWYTTYPQSDAGFIEVTLLLPIIRLDFVVQHFESMIKWSWKMTSIAWYFSNMTIQSPLMLSCLSVDDSLAWNESMIKCFFLAVLLVATARIDSSRSVQSRSSPILIDIIRNSVGFYHASVVADHLIIDPIHDHCFIQTVCVIYSQQNTLIIVPVWPKSVGSMIIIEALIMLSTTDVFDETIFSRDTNC